MQPLSHVEVSRSVPVAVFHSLPTKRAGSCNVLFDELRDCRDPELGPCGYQKMVGAKKGLFHHDDL